MIYVFDLDGTLINSSKRHWLLMKMLLEAEGIKVGANFSKEYLAFKADGKSGMMYLTDALGMPPIQATLIQQKWVDHIEDDELLELDILYEDTMPVLNNIYDEILFLTARENTGGLKKELIRLGLDQYETIIIKHGESKASALKDLEPCIMIGDTEIDYQASVERGCYHYILNRGFRSKYYWDSRNVDSHESLMPLLDMQCYWTAS